MDVYVVQEQGRQRELKGRQLASTTGIFSKKFLQHLHIVGLPI